jgi:hypothetical protein
LTPTLAAVVSREGKSTRADARFDFAAVASRADARDAPMPFVYWFPWNPPSLLETRGNLQGGQMPTLRLCPWLRLFRGLAFW